MYFHIRYSVVMLDRTGYLTTLFRVPRSTVNLLPSNKTRRDGFWKSPCIGVLRKISENKREEVTGENHVTRSSIFCTPPQIFPLSYQGQWDENGHVAHVGRREKCMQILMGKS